MTTTARPELSLLLRCHTRAAQVQRLLRHVAPHVDEVVVAADARMTEPEFATLAAAEPDVLMRLPFLPPVERSLAYLHGRSSGRWVLRLDGDELPSLALLGALRELIADASVVAHLLPRAWLWPALDRRLALRPWWPDVQARLVRNDPAIVSFPGYTHSSATPHGPVRLFEAPGLWHADLALASVAERADKAARYDAERPGLQMLGMPFNAAYYRPEEYAEPPVLAAVPEADRAVLEDVFAGPTQAPSPPLGEPPPLVAEADIDATWAQRPWPPEAYDCPLEVLEPDLRFGAGETRRLLVAVENRGTRTLPWGDHELPVIRLSYRWLGADGRAVVSDGVRTGLPGPVAPGERRVAELSVTAPPGDGEHVLEVDLVHEHVRWFGQPVRVRVAVR